MQLLNYITSSCNLYRPIIGPYYHRNLINKKKLQIESGNYLPHSSSGEIANSTEVEDSPYSSSGSPERCDEKTNKNITTKI